MTPFTFLLLRVTKCNHEKTSQPRSAYSAFSWQNHVLFVSFFGNVEESRTKHVIQKTSLVHITAILHYCNFFMAHYAPIVYATLCIYHDNHRKILAFSSATAQPISRVIPGTYPEIDQFLQDIKILPHCNVFHRSTLPLIHKSNNI